jgi:hypothetical protein
MIGVVGASPASPRRLMSVTTPEHLAATDMAGRHVVHAHE